MTTTIDYLGTTDHSSVNTVIFVGLRESLQTAVARDVFSSEDPPAVVADLIATLAPGKDKFDAVVSTYARTEADSSDDTPKPTGGAGSAGAGFSASGRRLVKIVAVALPTACSRHNSKARPHSITDAVRAHASGNTAVIVVTPTEDELFSSGVAIARAFPMYNAKTHAKKDRTVWVSLYTLEGEVKTSLLTRVANVADGARHAARLVDMPTNELNTVTYTADATARVADLPDTTVTVIKGKELDERGFGGMWGVGRASPNLPALVVIEYKPESAASSSAPVVVMVGKGIVYDTGGLSIKTKTGMPGMKRDMGGSAAILQAFHAIVKTGYSQRIAAILCLAENSVGPESTRPDDVLHMYSGKTVEVNNTDAEGRLVLGDGVAYAEKHLNPDVIIDMATLTGAQGISTGQKHGALYTNDEALETMAVAAGKTSGDLVHPLPYCPEFYRAEFRSAVADMKNSVANRSNAQSSCAGQFIGNHLSDAFLSTKRWLHIDMAAPAKAGERATGFGVALLAEITAQLARTTSA